MCRGCGSPSTLFRGSKHSRFLGRDFGYWRCPGCELMFVEPFPGYVAYNDAYYQGRGADPYVDYEAEYRDYRATFRMEELDDLWRLASGHIGRAAATGPVAWLDFGCGAGGLLKYLADKSAVKTAAGARTLELSGHDIGVYAERLRGDGWRILGLDELKAQPDATYDVISMIEVVEHLEHPDPAIALAARLLKPGGLLLLTTGNVASPAARVQGLSYGYCMPEVHVSYFTPSGLEILYARHGLEPVRFRYHGAIRFKVLKTLRTPARQRIAGVLMRLPLVVRLVDVLFGTSRMPCAVKRA